MGKPEEINSIDKENIDIVKDIFQSGKEKTPNEYKWSCNRWTGISFLEDSSRESRERESANHSRNTSIATAFEMNESIFFFC